MTEAEPIREKVLEAAARLDRADAALKSALRRQEAYRSSRFRALIHSREVPVDAPAEGAPQEDWLRWVLGSTPEEDEYQRRLRGNQFVSLRLEMTRARAALYTPEFEEAIESLRKGRSSGVEVAVAYFEADPWHYHSGYLKEKLARWLRRVPLTEEQRERLRHALLGAIQKGRREDLSEYVSLGRKLDSVAFRLALGDFAAKADEGTAYRARRILDACKMND